MTNYFIEFDIASIVLFIILIANYLVRKHFRDRLSMIYVSLMLTGMLTAATDIVSAYVIEKHFPVKTVLMITGLYFVFLACTTFMFLSYVVYQLETDSHMSSVLKHTLRLPIIYYTLFVLTNGITGWLFTYSVEEGYSKGPLQILGYIISMSYFGGTLIYVIVKRKVLDDRLQKAVYNIAFVNVFTVTAQFIFPKHMLLCFGFAVSMVILAMSSTNREIQIDQRTGMLSRESMAAFVEKCFYNEKKFDAILVRVADYDQLSNIYGIQITDVLISEIAKYLIELVGIGNAFQTNNSTFVLVYDDNEKTTEDIHAIDAKLSSNWEIEGQIIPFSYLITHVSVPLRAKNKDAFIACITYFEKMKRMRYGIVPPEELAVRDKVRETVVERAIIEGLSEGNFSVFYQPICTSKDQIFVSAEALVRLKDPELGYISPAEFIPVAEKSGLMISVGNFVFESVCQFVHKYDMKDLGLEYIEVNLSVVQCLQRDFISFVKETIAKYNVSPSNICFEITETAANCSPEIFTNNLSELVNIGFKLALDDFGSGYGNLERMVTSKFSLVKFDKGMTERICTTEKMREGFGKMIQLFRMLNLLIVSEGVETEEQYNYLVEAGADYIQGYFFAKPMPERPFVDFLIDHLK